jgi:protein phosphatase
MKLRWSARTDVGRARDHNEDAVGAGTPEQAARLGQLLVLCDGMGGYAAGEVASQMAIETILASFYADDTEDPGEALRDAFQQANAQIYAEGRGAMGTTGVAALLRHDALYVANVGDSRAYLLRDGTIRQISHDHSFVSDQIAAGLITAEEARSSPVRNVITRALGHQAEVEVDLFRFPLQSGDRVLLCSDGLHSVVRDSELLELAGGEPDAATAALVALANERGGPDNISVTLAVVDGLEWEMEPLAGPPELAASAAATPSPAPPAAVPAAPPPARRTPEKRLTLLGGLLATILLAALLFVLALTLLTAPATAPPVFAPATILPTSSP